MGYGDKSKKEKAAEAAAMNEAKKAQSEEAAAWAETDKGANKKLARASAAEQKAAEAERIRQEKKALEEADNAESGAVHDKAQAKKTKQTPGKLTQAQIQQNMALMAAAAGAAAGPKKSKKTSTVDAPEILPNPNRSDEITASSVEDALKHLSLEPGKRMTYKQFEAEMAEKVKAENPGLKRNQVTDKVWKLWDRSPVNPKNQVES
mmetsp:Transcript_25795/g.65038  ORF Transcript_25795/g.65038 Transcript_25795/m.65038 type:complete len:206 (-) Transcript_25795:622-1239(-)|eukprot:g5652.t1